MTDEVLKRLFDVRMVFVSGYINQEMAELVVAQLMILDAESHDPISVMVASNGGESCSALAMYDAMRFVESPVISTGAGWVASGAVYVFLGADKDKRFCLPNTRFLLHQPTTTTSGTTSDISIEAQEMVTLRQQLNLLTAKETGQPVSKVTQDTDRNFWMSAKEAVKYGLVAKVVTSARYLRRSRKSRG